MSGFTIVELLIVIVVIAILAAISIVAYNGIQNRAAETALKSDLRNAATRLGIDSVGTDTFPVGNTPPASIHASPGTHFQYSSPTGADYCLTATSSRSGVGAWHVTNTESIRDGVCTGHSSGSGGGGGPSWPIRDDFAATENPPAQTDTGQSYLTTGAWTSGSGNLLASADTALITVDVGGTTQTVEAVWAGPWHNQSFPTFVVLYENGSTHYRIQRGGAGSSNIAIIRRGGTGDANLYYTSNGVLAAGDRVRVAVTRAVGNTQFTIWVNGAQVGTYTDTAANPPNGTRAGFRYGAGAGGTGFSYREFRADNRVVGP